MEKKRKEKKVLQRLKKQSFGNTAAEIHREQCSNKIGMKRKRAVAQIVTFSAVSNKCKQK